jgi:hypothetical protein
MQRFLLLLLFIFPLILVAQEKPHTDQSLYVVIGAFGVPEMRLSLLRMQISRATRLNLS